MRQAAHRVFLAGDKLNVHVLPVHYYTNVASRKQLHGTEKTWRRPLEPMPFEWDMDAQLSWVREVAGTYPTELPLEVLYARSETVGGFRYGPIEAQFLYSFIRSAAPARIVEIGSGSSTLVMSDAVSRNVADGKPGSRVLACDPYTAGNVDGLPHVEAKPIGGLDLNDEVLSLQAGDLLFIDSTHAVRTGSELAHLYLELLPQLQPGVIIHIHDIYLPYLFTPDLYTTMFDWQETTLVAALLAGNSKLRIKAALSGLFDARSDGLGEIFPEYTPRVLDRGITVKDGHYPSSLYLQAH